MFLICGKRLFASYLAFLAMAGSIVGIDDLIVTNRDRARVYQMYPPYEHLVNSPINILSIDGGGVRGVIAASFLADLENDISPPADGHHEPMPIWRMFDLIVGTSTGGLLSLGLTTPIPGDGTLRSATAMRDTYIQLSREVFPPLAPVENFFAHFKTHTYNPAPLERRLLEYFGPQRLSDIPIPVVITTVNPSRNELKLFASYKCWEKNPFVRDVARATSAAPTFFPMHHIPNNGPIPSTPFIDGGLAANNPSVVALAEARRIFGDQRDINLISVGTGKRQESILVDEPIYIMRAKPVIETLFSAQSNAAEYVLSSLSENDLGIMGVRYHRFQVPLEGRLLDMDKASNIPELITRYEEYRQENYDLYLQIVEDIRGALIQRADELDGLLNADDE